MSQFHFRPDDYLELIHAEVPAYDELQDQVAAAAEGPGIDRILELGTGTGETARRLLRKFPKVRLTGIDVSSEMLAAARRSLPSEQIDALMVRAMQDPLPEGPFDRVISALCVHHLDGPGKSDLFHRVAHVLSPGGRFVMGDVIVPGDPSDVITPLSPDYDMPSSLDDLLHWLGKAGFESHITWSSKDLAVIRATLA